MSMNWSWVFQLDIVCITSLWLIAYVILTRKVDLFNESLAFAWTFSLKKAVQHSLSLLCICRLCAVRSPICQLLAQASDSSPQCALPSTIISTIFHMIYWIPSQYITLNMTHENHQLLRVSILHDEPFGDLESDCSSQRPRWSTKKHHLYSSGYCSLAGVAVTISIWLLTILITAFSTIWWIENTSDVSNEQTFFCKSPVTLFSP